MSCPSPTKLVRPSLRTGRDSALKHRLPSTHDQTFGCLTALPSHHFDLLIATLTLVASGSVASPIHLKLDSSVLKPLRLRASYQDGFPHHPPVQRHSGACLHLCLIAFLPRGCRRSHPSLLCERDSGTTRRTTRAGTATGWRKCRQRQWGDSRYSGRDPGRHDWRLWYRADLAVSILSLGVSFWKRDIG